MLHTHIIFLKRINSLALSSFVLLMCLFVFALNPLLIDDTKATVDQDPNTVLSLSTSTIDVKFRIDDLRGNFSTSNFANIGVTTNNYTGYSLKMTAPSDDENASRLVSDEYSIDSIDTPSEEEDFTDDTWGIIPSKFNSEENELYLPAPNTEGLLIDRTTAANAETNSYTLGFAIKASDDIPAGNYTNAFNITVMANPATYHIDYGAGEEGSIFDIPDDEFGFSNAANIIISRQTPRRVEGYNFVAWCSGTVFTSMGTDSCDSDFYRPGDPFELDPTSDNEINLVSMWEPVIYHISYELNGGSANNRTEYHIESGNITLTNPTKNGYTFTGWSGTDIEGTTATVTISNGSIGDREFVAHWTPTNCNINYNLNGGSASGNPTSYNIETATFTLNNPTRSYYDFKGWSGTGLSGDTNKNVTIATGNTGERNYTANWTPTNYNISYNLNGGSASGNPTSYNVETNSFTLNNPTRNGYTFKGWSGTGLSGDSNKTVTIAKGSNGARGYVANWTPITYTITYHGSNASNPTSYTIETNTFALNNPTQNGYTFKGWTGSNGSTAQTSVSIAKGSTGDKVYYTNWTPINYSITYNLNGGTVSPANPSSYNIETATFTLRNPTKPGHTFTGWTGSNGSTAQTSVSIAKGSTGAKSYTANWRVNNYYLDVNGLLDGTTSGGISGYGTVDVYVNGSRVADDVPDYYAQHAYGSTYEIKDIKIASGKQYDGVSSGSLSGTIGEGNVAVQLKFSTIPCTFSSKEFTYNGTVQPWTVPTGCSGTYKLEVYGAAGGNALTGSDRYTAAPGKGGYATGIVTLSAGTTIYVVVGGKGATANENGFTAGGYNGGGQGSWYNGGGGGATHIGKTNAQLKDTTVGNLYIVAGGGGGGGSSHINTNDHPGGDGGGTSGGNVLSGPGGATVGYGGNQNAGGTSEWGYSGVYGVGGSVTDRYGGGGGGGGYYGGAGTGDWNGGCGGGGGSGYTGGVSSGSMTSGVQTNNGWAKITKQ